MDFNNPNLTHKLVEHIRTMTPTPEQAASFEAILTTPDNCGKEVGPALQWARTSEFAALLPQKNGPVVRKLSVPLLIWGVRQPWADTISASHVLNFWFNQDQNEHTMPENKALDQAWATYVIWLVAHDPLANRSVADDFCRQWFYYCDIDQALWQSSFSDTSFVSQLHDAWLNFARLALPDLRDLERPQDTLQKTWSLRMGTILKELPLEQQVNFLLKLLDSDFSNTIKKTIAKKAPAQSWLDPRVYAKLRPLLPAVDHACYLELPWSKPKHPAKPQDAIQLNQALPAMYCPKLAPAFSLMLRDNDWTNRELVCRMAMQSRASENECESLPLEGLGL